jgi:hypothetical protein
MEPFDGTELCVSLAQLIPNQIILCGFEKFGFFSISSDYGVGRGVGFGDFQGFFKKEGKYFGKITTKEFEIPTELVQEITNSNGVQMIKVIGKTDEVYGDFPTPGEGWLGAIINTHDEIYPGLTVTMELTNGLNEEIFDQILSTFKFIEEKQNDEEKITQLFNQKITNVSPPTAPNIEWKITDVEIEGEWAFIEATFVYSETGEIAVGEGAIILFRKIDQQWTMAIMGTDTYKSWLDEVPSTLVPEDLKMFIR